MDTDNTKTAALTDHMQHIATLDIVYCICKGFVCTNNVNIREISNITTNQVENSIFSFPLGKLKVKDDLRFIPT